MTETGTTELAPASFAERIREASWAAHRAAESAPYLRALVSGRLDRTGYAAMVAQHLFAYEVLETASDRWAHDPIVGFFDDERLRRVPALEADLEALLGPAWRKQVSPSPATAAYCDRMQERCFDWPGGWVAHHYVRYLGDLSGGQFIARVLEDTYGIGPSDGAAFYDFSRLGDLDAYKARYRATLDAAPWDDAQREAIIEEVLAGYEHNTRVLLDPSLDGFA